MASVYWAARELDTWWGLPGNHQFLLIYLGTDESLLQTRSEVQSGYRFSTLGGHDSGGNLVLIPNQTADVTSVKEVYKKYVTTLTDYDLEQKKINPPGGSGWSFALKVEELSYNYLKNTAIKPQAYDLWDTNCATWVNTLLKVAGVPESERRSLGEFSGIDWGEEDLLDESLFK
jgi:hypothetical protein